uniref:Uncharacterized protein n=1 Tax=Hyaloperonospora arabidopsidis (strain Emoy2) TaxID=559515 RepID=M4BD72_HYAAE
MQLFEGAPGSEAQYAANTWLMQFQNREEAWQAALQLLDQPVCDPITRHPLDAPQLVAMQILRLKTQHEWSCTDLHVQQTVRQVSESSCCGALPIHILALETKWTTAEMQEVLKIFQAEARDVMTAMRVILANMSSAGKVMTKEQQTSACRGLSRIACCLAMNHATVLFSNQKTGTPVLVKRPAPEQQDFSIDFLELLLACSSYEDIYVVQPTLEIWFFFLESNALRNEISWHRLDTAGQKHAASILSRLVDALIRQCKYPQWFIETHEIVSDDPDIEAIAQLRRTPWGVCGRLRVNPKKSPTRVELVHQVDSVFCSEY